MSTMLPAPPEPQAEGTTEQLTGYTPTASPPSVPSTPPPTPPRKRALRGWQWAVIGGGGVLPVLVLLAAIAAAGGGGGKSTSNSPPANQPPAPAATSAPATQAPAPPATTAPQPQSPQPFTVGQAADVGGYIVTVNSFKVVTSDNEFEQPAAGHQYVQADVTLVNATGQPQTVSSYDFQFQDSSGQTYSETFISSASSFGGTVVNQGKIRGQLVYEVPKTEKAFTLLYQPNFLENSTIGVWSLSL